MSVSLEALGRERWELSPVIEQASAPPALAEHETGRPAHGVGDHRHAHWGAHTVIACPEGARARKAGKVKARIAAVAGALAVLSVPVGFGLQAGYPDTLLEAGIAPLTEVRYAPPPRAELDTAQPVATPPLPTTPSHARQQPPRAPRFTITRSASRVSAVSPEHMAARHFRRGNALATQGRWGEARAAYAEAVARDPRPDYAFNLAVSWEHLGRRAAALAYYRKALAGAHDGSAGFAPDVARARIAALSQGGDRP